MNITCPKCLVQKFVLGALVSLVVCESCLFIERTKHLPEKTFSFSIPGSSNITASGTASNASVSTTTTL